MFTRVLLNITKHKVLNILLIFLLILSFVGITFSSVFVYKTNQFLNEIDSADDFIIVNSEEYSNDVVVGEGEIDSGTYLDIYKMLEDNDEVETSFTLYPMNIEVKEFQVSADEYTEDMQYVSLLYSENDAKDLMNLEDGYDKSKVYISQSVADEYEYQVGDNLELVALTSVGSITDASSINYDLVKEVEIGGIYDLNEEYSEGLFVYIPGDIFMDVDESLLYMAFAKVVITGSEEEIAKVYEDIKDYSNDTNIYYSKDVESKDLEFFIKIRSFFIIICLSTLVIFTFSILSLNNNAMERRSEEFRLYNVFGLGSGEILFQLILEKLVLLFMSLIISIPLFIFVLRVGNGIVDNLVEYTFGNEMILGDLIYETGNQELMDKLYNGISAIEVSNILVIIFGIIAMFIIMSATTVLQFLFRRNSIVNQRRGE